MSSLIVQVVKIDKIIKHPNADRLRIASFKDMGWNCIIGLDDFNEGNLVVFVPPDCTLPDDLIEEYKLDYLKKGGRTGTIKLRGFISQGLCLSVPEGKNWKEGQGVASELGITKYEPPKASYQGRPSATIKSTLRKFREGKITFRQCVAKSVGIIRNSFKPKKNLNPLFNKYTDIENIKNFNRIFSVDDRIVISEKIHGTNFRAGKLKRPTKYFWQRWLLKLLGEYEFVYGSHNVQITGHRNRKCFYGDDVYGRIAKKYDLAEIIPEGYILYGEIYGKKIQELEYGMDDIDIAFFDLKYEGKYVSYHKFQQFCRDRNLPTVPELYDGHLSPKDIKLFTNGISVLADSNGEKQIREGCVIKCTVEEMHPRLGRKVLKSISEEYLVTKSRTEHH